MKVKKLVWEKDCAKCHPHDGTLVYSVASWHAGYMACCGMTSTEDGWVETSFDTAKEAEEACQKHYENLILSGLEEI